MRSSRISEKVVTSYAQRGLESDWPEFGLGSHRVGEKLDGGVLDVVVRRDHADVESRQVHVVLHSDGPCLFQVAHHTLHLYAENYRTMPWLESRRYTGLAYGGDRTQQWHTAHTVYGRGLRRTHSTRTRCTANTVHMRGVVHGRGVRQTPYMDVVCGKHRTRTWCTANTVHTDVVYGKHRTRMGCAVNRP